ncbi:MAG: exosortase-associated EpsI family protein [Opitutaceae bacterium]
MNARLKSGVLWGTMALALVTGALWQYYPLADANGRLAALPERGLWMASEAIPVSETEEQIYRGAAVLKRLVAVRGQRVVMTVVDGSGNRHAVHDPLFCFRGAGWEVTGQAPLALERGAARQVDLRRRGETAEAVYWFSDGTRAFDSAMEYWWRTTMRRVTLGASGAEPVLIMLTPVDERPVNWEALLAAWPEIAAF